MSKRFVAAITAVVAAALVLVGCNSGGTASNTTTGRYEGYAITMGDSHSPMSDTYNAGENYVELNDDGAAVLCLDGSPIDATYTIDGENITITIGGNEDEESYDSTGTVKDGVLTFDFLGMGLELTFVKDGVDKPFDVVPLATSTEEDSSASEEEVITTDDETAADETSETEETSAEEVSTEETSEEESTEESNQ